MAQGFIKRHHCPRMLFADIAELGGDVAFDVLSQSKPTSRCCLRRALASTARR